MRRFPVTNREYLGFLNALVAAGRTDEALRHAPRERGGVDNSGRLVYQRSADGTFRLGPDADGDEWLPDYPVFMVDWTGARAFAAWEAERTGLPWRLPGELEWEKAARGVDGRLFPWGNRLDPSWCCMAASHPGRMLPAEVDTFPADVSPYGVRGMGGNVRDWCLDAFNDAGQSCPDGLVPHPEPGADDVDLRVLRGGTWDNDAVPVRAASRTRSSHWNRHANHGMRLIRRLVNGR
jgi:serine/threonine-protein kinase